MDEQMTPKNYDTEMRQLVLNLTPRISREDRISIINQIIKLSEIEKVKQLSENNGGQINHV